MIRTSTRTRVAAAALCAGCKQALPQGAKFCPQCGLRVALAAGSPAQTQPDLDGERRQASVLFVDLVGSTTLASTMDPEAFRDLLRGFRRPIEQVVDAYGGMVAQYFGDGVLIFFGYPSAREDAAEQAVSAALDMVEALRAADTSGKLRVRIGVATGIVVGGDQGEKPFSLGDVAVGGPLWLAARLQGVAPDDGVVVSEATYNVAGHLFECRSLGAQSLKGYEKAVPAWLVMDRKRAPGRFAARRASRGTSPIVGRDSEIEALLNAWETVKRSGKAAVAAIVGEAGLGKSRLVEALLEHLASESFVLMQYHCAPRFRNTALYPVIAQVERAAGLERDDTADAKLRKLQALLARSTTKPELARSVAYFAALLSIPCGTPYPPLPEAPDRRKEGLLATLEAHLTALAARSPLMLLLEDWHWCDPSTRELTSRAIAAVTGCPVLVVVTSRVEFEPGSLSGQPLTIRLRPLADEHCSSLIEHVAGGRGLPPQIVTQVLRKAEGVPLYVEEITKSVIDAGASDAGAGGDAAVTPLLMPGTLRDLMLSRLDSLARAKDVAQVGAAVGREFSYRLLRALLPSGESDLRAALEALVRADLVHRKGAYPDAQFQFRHALIQDAAYDTILLGRRPALHLQIAGALLDGEPDIADTRPEVLAHHFLEGGNMRRASEYFQRAGQRAASRAANVEAGEHFRAAIRGLEALPPSDDRHQRELDIRVELGLTVTALHGYAGPEVSAEYERARRLCAMLGNNAAQFPVLRGLWTYYIMRAEFDTALDLAHECARIGQETGRADHRIEALATIGYTLVYQGKLVQGRRALEDAVSAYRAAPPEFATALTVRHGIMAAYALIAITAWMQGEIDHAAYCSQESLALAEATGRPFDFAYALCFAAMLANFQGDTARAIEHADRGIAYASEHAFKDWLVAGKAQRAIAGILRGEASKSRDVLAEAAERWQAGGAELNRHVFVAGHAAALAATFNLTAAVARVDEAIAHAERFHEHWLDAEIHRLRGMILEFIPGSADAASEAYRNAVRIALAQEAPYLALRSGVRLLACDRKAGRASDAGEIVAHLARSLEVTAGKTAEYADAMRLLAA